MTRIATPLLPATPTQAATPAEGPRTIADLLARLDDVPPSRVRYAPLPGTATERDLLEVLDHEGIICELIDGVLVEKAMGYEESRIAFVLGSYLGEYLRCNNLGIAVGADGVLKLTNGFVRAPDLSFIYWNKLPGRKFPQKPIPKLAIDLAVEVLSKANTRSEMERKLREYFDAGVRLVWSIEPKKRTARVYTSVDRPTILRDGDTLDGGDVLPGFALPLKTLFDEATRGPGA